MDFIFFGTQTAFSKHSVRRILFYTYSNSYEIHFILNDDPTERTIWAFPNSAEFEDARHKLVQIFGMDYRDKINEAPTSTKEFFQHE